jgi:membrane protein
MGPAPSKPAPVADPQSPWVGRAVNAWRLVVAVVLGYRGESLALRAGNLTFITITSLVPLVAVILALVHGFDVDRTIEHLVMRFFEDILSPGGRAQSQSTIRKFLDAANSPAGGSFSFVLLLVSSAILLRHLDASLNEVWAVRRRRPLLISGALYFGALLVGPLLMVLTLLGTDTAKPSS